MAGLFGGSKDKGQQMSPLPAPTASNLQGDLLSSLYGDLNTLPSVDSPTMNRLERIQQFAQGRGLKPIEQDAEMKSTMYRLLSGER